MRMLARNADVVETAVGVGEQKERGGGGRCLGLVFLGVYMKRLARQGGCRARAPTQPMRTSAACMGEGSWA